MTRSAAIYLYFVSIACLFNGYYCSTCLLSDPGNQCGYFCLTSLMSKMQGGDSCEANWQHTFIGLDALKGDVNKVRKGQKALQTTHKDLDAIITNIDNKLNGKDMILGGDWLEKLEKQSVDHFNDLQEIENALDDIPKNPPSKFTKYGDRSFFVETKKKVNWYIAEHSCRSKGGFLASPSKEDLDAMKSVIKGSSYWLGITDLASEGLFISYSNGDPAAYLSWHPHQPNNTNPNSKRSQDCVVFHDGHMDDVDCKDKNLFICQADRLN